MKMKDAEDIISGKADRSGFIVSFEVRERGMLRGDFFPDVHGGEPGFATVDIAWDNAEQFARRRTSTRDIVNVRVCRASDFTPVGNQTLNEYK